MNGSDVSQFLAFIHSALNGQRPKVAAVAAREYMFE
jgi:hypothetical protein